MTTVTTDRPRVAEDKLDQVLAELRDIRVILEGLMQPLVTVEPPCGECHLQPGETCDICGAQQRLVDTGELNVDGTRKLEVKP